MTDYLSEARAMGLNPSEASEYVKRMQEEEAAVKVVSDSSYVKPSSSTKSSDDTLPYRDPIELPPTTEPSPPPPSEDVLPYHDPIELPPVESVTETEPKVSEYPDPSFKELSETYYVPQPKPEPVVTEIKIEPVIESVASEIPEGFDWTPKATVDLTGVEAAPPTAVVSDTRTELVIQPAVFDILDEEMRIEEKALITDPFMAEVGKAETEFWLGFEKQIAGEVSKAKADVSHEQLALFDVELASWKAEQTELAEESVALWRAGEMEKLEDYAVDWRAGWKPKGLSERMLESPIFDSPVFEIPIFKKALSGLGGVVASVESFGYGAGSLLGVPTPRSPPTLSGGLVTSAIQSWEGRPLLQPDFQASPELEKLVELGPEYVFGTVAGDILVSFAVGKVVQKTVIDPVLKPLYRGSRVEKYLLQHSDWYYKRYALELATETVYPGVSGKKQVIDIKLADSIGVTYKGYVNPLQAEEFFWDQLMTGKELGRKIGRTAAISVSKEPIPVLARTFSPSLPHLVFRSGTLGTGYLSPGKPMVDSLSISPKSYAKQTQGFLSSQGSLVSVAKTVQAPKVASAFVTPFVVDAAKAGKSLVPSVVGSLSLTGLKMLTPPKVSTLEVSVIHPPKYESFMPRFEFPLVPTVTKTASLTIQKPKAPSLEPPTQISRPEFFPLHLPDVSPVKSKRDQRTLMPVLPKFPSPQTLLFTAKPRLSMSDLEAPFLRSLPKVSEKTVPVLDVSTMLIPDLDVSQLQVPVSKLKPTTYEPSFPLPPMLFHIPKFMFPRRRGMRKPSSGRGRRRGKRKSVFDKQEYLYPVAGFGEMFGKIFGVGKSKAKRSKPRKRKKKGKRKRK